MWEKFTSIFNPAVYSQLVLEHGWWLLAIIVFAENGLFFLFFLPGDYLLFLSGLFCSQGYFSLTIFELSAIVSLAAIAGSYLGYFTGKWYGSYLSQRKNNWFFKPKYIAKTRVYFIKYGAATLIICRFLPIVRTFAPILAGMANMPLSKFSSYIISGGVLWVGSLMLSGYYLGNQFPALQQNIDYIIYFFVGLTSAVVLMGWLRLKRKTKDQEKKRVE